MSTILKALRRLEEEKAAAAPRELREEVAAAPPPPSRGRSRLWLPGAVLAGLCALAGAAWWGLALGGDAEGLPAVAQAPEAQAPVVVERAAEVERPSLPVLPARVETAPNRSPDAVEGLPEHAFSSAVEVVARPAAKPRIPMDEPAAPTASAPLAAPPQVAQAEPAQPDPAAKPALARVEPGRVVSVPRPSAPAPDPPPPSRASAAAVVEPEVAPDPLPSLRVEKTFWHPRPERREAIVVVDGAAGRRIHEGEVVGGTLVSEIQPSGVVFERDGETLRRAIGE